MSRLPNRGADAASLLTGAGVAPPTSLLAEYESISLLDLPETPPAKYRCTDDETPAGAAPGTDAPTPVTGEKSKPPAGLALTRLTGKQNAPLGSETAATRFAMWDTARLFPPRQKIKELQGSSHMPP